MLDGFATMVVVAFFVLAGGLLLSIYGRETSSRIDSGLAAILGGEPSEVRCLHCHKAWKHMHRQIGGLEPLCVDCWRELGSPEARMPYYEQSWKELKGNSGPISQWDQIEAAVQNGG